MHIQNWDRSQETGLSSSIWLYIWRFQPFHNGHKKVLDTMLLENELCIVLIGLSEDEAKNPYDFSTRLHFFTHTYSPTSHLSLYPLPDEASDSIWIKHILCFHEIQSADEIVIYAGDMKHDSAIQVIQTYQHLFWEKKLSFREISREDNPISGNQVRQKIQETGLESVKDQIPVEVYEYLSEI